MILNAGVKILLEGRTSPEEIEISFLKNYQMVAEAMNRERERLEELPHKIHLPNLPDVYHEALRQIRQD